MSHIFHSVITKHSPDLQRPAKSPQPLSREPISLPPPRQDNGNATQVLLLENQFRSTSPTPKCILYYNYNHLDFFPDPKIPKSPVKYILGKQLATSPSPPLGVQINQSPISPARRNCYPRSTACFDQTSRSPLVLQHPMVRGAVSFWPG